MMSPLNRGLPKILDALRSDSATISGRHDCLGNGRKPNQASSSSSSPLVVGLRMGNSKNRSRGKRRKFIGNQFRAVSGTKEATEEAETGGVCSEVTRESASKRKLSFGIPSWIVGGESDSESDSSDSLPSNPDSDSEAESSAFSAVPDAETPLSDTGYRLADLEKLQILVCEFCVCRSCKKGDVVVKKTSRAGLTSCVTLSCTYYDAAIEFPLVKKSGHFYECNRRGVLAARVIGRSHGALQKFCGVMNLPPPVTAPGFHAHQRALIQACKTVGEKSMKKAAAEVRSFNRTQDNPEGINSVTFDGTWMRRSFTSLYGVFACVSWDTGRVLDVHVSSKYCHACVSWKFKREHRVISQQVYEDRAMEHQAVCPVNTECSAPAMESEAALILWRRSVELRTLQYQTFISDGDSKSYSKVRDAMPYGEDAKVVKEECIGHVQKHVGSRLRTLKKNMRGQVLADGKPIGGQGRLTDQLIDDLQTYYGKAIRNHPNDLQSMAKAIWASLCHLGSTDDKPMHMFCPEGKGSWCRWQRLASVESEDGDSDSNTSVEPLEPYVHRNSIPPAIMDVIKPIYVDVLTNIDLLQRCLRGATQNQNEILNGLIWSLCPKKGFCGPSVAEMSTYLAVAHFNNGAVSPLAVLREMACEEGYFTERQLRLQDAVRVQKAEKKMKEAEKKRRKVRRRRRKGKDEQKLDDEGVTYETGAF